MGIETPTPNLREVKRIGLKKTQGKERYSFTEKALKRGVSGGRQIGHGETKPERTVMSIVEKNGLIRSSRGGGPPLLDGFERKETSRKGKMVQDIQCVAETRGRGLVGREPKNPTLSKFSLSEMEERGRAGTLMKTRYSRDSLGKGTALGISRFNGKRQGEMKGEGKRKKGTSSRDDRAPNKESAQKTHQGRTRDNVEKEIAQRLIRCKRDEKDGQGAVTC